MTRKDDEMDAQANDKPAQANNKAKAAGAAQQGGSPSKSSAAAKALITRNLRLAYNEVAAEPMPQRFLDLLNAIDGAEKKS